ncbi:hypothetical protein Q9Q94_10220 [Uliginosibacterium sp. 31-16]|uniref:GIY-YIG nuclease family protein n=1 Tax=Uliginosibacterium sp. 31-16 TaxID=3068315 RepID=UPI00273D26DE|nr:hypothetical protein [Uliginosibacterium sp. 31-16]MDP5239910.1 hypothetical protein [Uliginosibacterium sp. 31-16]
MADAHWKGVNFDAHAPDVNWNDVGGIYIMAKKQPSGGWHPFYIGQAKSLKDRLSNHEQWPSARRLGATHILAAVVGQQAERDRIERDLIQSTQPQLNTQLK